jgi:hypothetical protein
VDPLLLEALRLGVAILAGGIVAVIAQRIAFRHAQQLQRADQARQLATLRRSLIAEIRENIRRLGGDAVTQVPSAGIVRSAWDAAHGLPLGDDLFDAIAVAYLHGAELDQQVAFSLRNIATRGVVWSWSTENRARKKLIETALARAQAAHAAFIKALQLLEKGEPSIF